MEENIYVIGLRLFKITKNVHCSWDRDAARMLHFDTARQI